MTWSRREQPVRPVIERTTRFFSDRRGLYRTFAAATELIRRPPSEMDESSAAKRLLVLATGALVLSCVGAAATAAAAANETGVHAKPLCKEVAFGCPMGYECRTPKEGCQSHCECYDPVANASLPQGCPIRVKPCEEGHFCKPDKIGDCHACNCDTPCSQATGRFSCKPKANQACTRRMARGSCPVCQCEECPPRVCPRDCYVIQLDAGCKEVCICTGKDGVPFALLNSATYSY